MKKLIEYILARMGEASTWQGIGFIMALTGAKTAGLDWGGAAALGGTVSGLIKTFLPDSWKTPS